MTNLVTQSNFESFNARSLEPEQVAKTFIPSVVFDSLTKRRHSIVIGPRGSGKTTLLKMLQQPALEAWRDPLARDYRSSIDFTGVFVAADISWSLQLQSLGGGKLDPDLHRRLSSAAFTTHVLRSLLGAMSYRLSLVGNIPEFPFRRVELDGASQVKLIDEICSAWHLRPNAATFLAARRALTARLIRISELALECAAARNPSECLAGEKFLALSFLSAAVFGVEAFNDAIRDHSGKWAFLFDELEIAPQWVLDDLLRAIRSSDQRLIFKLALSPFNANFIVFDDPKGIQPQHDFDQIPLWYAEQNQIIGFCDGLWKAMLKERGLPIRQPEAVLGLSPLKTSEDEWKHYGTAYRMDGPLGRAFATLSDNDSSFRSYLRENEIRPAEWSELDPNKRAALLRKVAPLVKLRNFYGAKRSRKRPFMYIGAPTLFYATEGNPRWFISMVGRLLDRWGGATRGISRSEQAYELQRAGERFSSLLRTIPVTYEYNQNHPELDIQSLIKRIGDFMSDAVLGGAFDPEPIGSFTVDNSADDGLVKMLGQALNAGALVYVPDENSPQMLLNSLRGKRFRLSYLLAPLYVFPMRLGRPISLGSILRGHPASPSNQPLLPFQDLEDE